MKLESICGTIIGAVAIWYMQHLELLPVGYLWNVQCNAKDILLVGGSVVLIVYKKIFSAQK